MMSRNAPNTQTGNVFADPEVIKGWTMMLQQMVEGDKVEVYLPPALGYAYPPIPIPIDVVKGHPNGAS